MAIIVCPECGEKISDTVKQCVHCGVKITVCAECGKVFAKNVEVCSECGYAFQQVTNNGIEYHSSKDVISKWEKSGISQKFIYSNYINAALFIISLVFLGIAVIKLLLWDDILVATETFSSIKTLLVFFVIFYVVQCAYSNFGEYGKTMMLSIWCVGNNIDINSVLRTTLQMDFDAMTLDNVAEELGGSQWCLRSAAYSKDVLLRTNIKKYNIIKLCLAAVTAIMLVVFFVTNVEIYMAAEILKSDAFGIEGWSFSKIENWWALIVAAISFIVNHFLSKHTEKIEEKANNDYVKQNLPDCFESYQKYVTSENFAEYILKRGENATK